MLIREKNLGLAYLRRSSGDQPNSFQTQFDWAVSEAKSNNVELQADWEDFEQKRSRGAIESNDLVFDDAISGNDLSRPGLFALIKRATSDLSISHVFVHKRDRLARPDDPIQAMQIERQLTDAGVTLVFSDRDAQPSESGEVDVASQLMSYLDYHQSGQYLKTMAERVLLAQRSLATSGYWNGGSAPYGFARALVSPDGEIEILERGRRIQQPGYHVRIVPQDTNKIAIWLRILDLADKGIGNKRIAAELNKMGVPSPNAGCSRRDNGIRRRVSGKWHPNTIKSLIENRTILGILDYGRRSEGRHRRLDKEGIRPLNQFDRRADKAARTIRNDPENVISSQLPFDSFYDQEKWERIQKEREKRGKSQRGIPRSRDLGRAPLSGRAIDLTDGCGHPMYSRRRGNRQILTCGRYMKSNATECKSNNVDSEAAITFVLCTLRQVIASHGGIDQIELILRAKVQEQAESVQSEASENALIGLENELAECKSQIDTAARRLATVQDDLVSDVERVLQQLKSKSKRLNRQISEARSRVQSTTSDPEQEIREALTMLDQIDSVASDLPARRDLAVLLRKLNLWLGLEFSESIKGKKRRVQKLVRGVMTFDERDLPIPPYGKDHLGSDPSRDSQYVDGTTASESRIQKNSQGDTTKISKKNARNGAGVSDESQKEGISTTKVIRGERI